MSYQDLTDLFGDLRPTDDGDLIVDPQTDDKIAIPAVAKFCAQLVVDADEPSLADDRLTAGDDEVQRAVQRPHRHAATVKAG